MFGRPEWFQLKERRAGLRPASWRGWGYTAIWMVVVGGPFLALISRGQAIESVVWLVASLGALVWDVRNIERAKRNPTVPAGEVLVIDEHTTPESIVTTKRFRFHG